jgi:hypothetical protein
VAPRVPLDRPAMLSHVGVGGKRRVLEKIERRDRAPAPDLVAPHPPVPRHRRNNNLLVEVSSVREVDIVPPR